jgi:uncharacterized membrane protein YbhN (UPF0104 family)
VVEKLVEVASLATIAIPVVIASRRRAHLGVGVLVLAAIAIVASLIVSLALRRSSFQATNTGDGDAASEEAGGGIVRRFFRQASQSIGILDRPHAWLESFAWAFVSDVVDLGTIALSAAAVGVAVGPLGWCAVLIGVNLAIAVPSVPGQFGVLEAGAMLVLAKLGIDNERAVAFALLYHGVHIVPFTMAGLAALLTPTLRQTAIRSRGEAAQG